LAGDGSELALGALELLTALLTASLYLTQRKQRDYAWISFLASTSALWILFDCVADFGPVARDLRSVSGAALDALEMIGFLGFYSAFAHRRKGLWTYTVCTAAVVDFGIEIVAAETLWLPSGLRLLLFWLAWTPVCIYPVIKTAQAVRQGDGESRLMLLPFVVLSVEFNLRLGFQSLAALGVVHDIPAFFSGFTFLGFQWNSFTCVRFFFFITVLALVVLRSNRTSREHAYVAGEVEAARQVQSLLIPATAPLTPGFEVDSAYLPAQQVGGDFFLTLPSSDGSLLIVIGDVSGKGLRAAMVVASIMGILRNESSRHPSEVLTHLNGALQGRIAGFATCLCACIDANGTMTVANAGHLCPYLGGQELELPGALPLGIAAQVQYDSCAVALPAGSRLTFYSDGVPEAQNETGELLGFERARLLSIQKAEAIAQAARAHGQTDDITVLTVLWTGPASDAAREKAA